MTVKACKKHGLTEHVMEGRGYLRCRKCRMTAVTRYRKKMKRRAIEYKGGKCKICSYNRCVRALEFHHLDPKQKEHSLSMEGLGSWEKTKTEADKCILVCANCHREIHAGLIKGFDASVGGNNE